jgi:hypothetical protein
MFKGTVSRDGLNRRLREIVLREMVFYHSNLYRILLDSNATLGGFGEYTDNFLQLLMTLARR